MKRVHVDLLGDIAETCYRNGLSFWYTAHVDHISIRKTNFSANDVETIEIVDRYLDDSPTGDNESVLNDILQTVNDYWRGNNG